MAERRRHRHEGGKVVMSRLGRSVMTAALAVLTFAACGGSAGRTQASTDKAQFSQPTRIDNRWFPLVSGMQFVYEGRAAEGGQPLPHQLVFTVTGLTKMINGVRTRVLWDRDYDAGQLAEGELTFHAQDDAGNVWNFGEYPERWDKGRLTGAPDTWIAGLDKARRGIVMPAGPRLGTPSYSQGIAPAIDFNDRAQVDKTGQKTCVPAGCYDNVLVTKEWSVPEPGAFQFKYYATDVGTVRVGFTGSDRDRETLVLVKVLRLDANALRDVDDQALEIDQRGYTVSPKVYGQTPHATPE